jgi:hypothetical protein
MSTCLRRREFIAGLGGMARSRRAQQPQLPVPTTMTDPEVDMP